MGSRPASPPRAGVVGAGIAGLSAAIALRRAGWEVEVFERSQFKNEIGAAISVPPNATRVLDHWGFDVVAAGAVPNQASRFAAAQSLTVFMYEEYKDVAETMGAASWSFHRVDLHRGLRKLATEEDTEHDKGQPVTIRLGVDVVGVDCDKGTLKLGNGDVVEKDFVVIADGAHVRDPYPCPPSLLFWLLHSYECLDIALTSPESAH